MSPFGAERTIILPKQNLKVWETFKRENRVGGWEAGGGRIRRNDLNKPSTEVLGFTFGEGYRLLVSTLRHAVAG